jgi:hypothetical protein
VNAIDQYLDELFDRLSGQGAAGRRMLEEATDHLRTAAAAKIDAGVPAKRAEREVVAQFGEASHVAGLLDRVHHGARLATAALRATLIAGRALLMLAGSYLAAALGLAVWGRSTSIMHQTAAIGGLILLVGGMVLLAGQLAIRAMRVTPTKPPYAMLGAATLTLAGVVIFVDLPLAVGLLFQQTGLWRHAAALTTGVAAANWLAISAARLTALRRSRRIPQTTTA